MNENIDLTQILKGLEGIELWSPLCGKCYLSHIREKDSYYPIVLVSNNEPSTISIEATKEGHYHRLLKNGECIVFPSKDQRDWSKFERPIPVDTPMMFASSVLGRWKLGYYATKTSKGFHVCFAEGKNSKDYATYITYNYYPYMIPFDKFDPNNIAKSLKYNIQK